MIYLDNAATTKPSAAVMDAVLKYSNFFFNPSAAYRPSLEAEGYLEEARETIAKALGCENNEVVFTSGGTESNNLAIMGRLAVLRPRRWHFITTMIEHPAVYEVMKRVEEMGHEVTYLPVNHSGVVEEKTLVEAIRENTALISIMHVNNEVGSINDIDGLARAAKRVNPNVIFHSDGVQAFCKMAPPSKAVDMYSMSAHKLHGPKGVGALMIRRPVRVAPVNIGGGQERGLRSGTENLGGIMGFAQAVKDYMAHRDEILNNMRICKRILAEGLNSIEGVSINGPDLFESAPHLLSVSFRNVKGEVMLHTLEASDIFVGTGSACSSKKKKENRVLGAMGLEPWKLQSVIRFSFCGENTVEEMNQVIKAVWNAVNQLRRLRRR